MRRGAQGVGHRAWANGVNLGPDPGPEPMLCSTVRAPASNIGEDQGSYSRQVVSRIRSPSVAK